MRKHKLTEEEWAIKAHVLVELNLLRVGIESILGRVPKEWRKPLIH